jgi:hypothetical protein
MYAASPAGSGLPAFVMMLMTVLSVRGVLSLSRITKPGGGGGLVDPDLPHLTVTALAHVPEARLVITPLGHLPGSGEEAHTTQDPRQVKDRNRHRHDLHIHQALQQTLLGQPS